MNRGTKRKRGAKGAKSCSFEPAYGLAGKYSKDDYGYLVSDVGRALSGCEDVCNKSYNIDRDVVMVKIAARTKQAARKARAALKKRGMDDLVRDTIYPWDTVREFW